MVYQCTLETCSVKQWGWIKYRASIPGNALFLAIFSLLLLIQIYQGYRYRTYGVSIAICLGLAMEIAGYIGRILLHIDPFWKPYFLTYLIDLTIGPTFLAAGIYLCMARIVIVYDGGSKRVARMKPRSYTLVFLGWDVLSLLLQAAGGAIASLSAFGSTEVKIGTNIMVAGLSVQVASLFLFIGLCADLAWKIHTRKHILNPMHASAYNGHTFKTFLWALALATLGIFVRSVFRVAELSEGFGGHLANDEVSFMILDGTMVIISCLALTIVHPGRGFGSVWQEANFTFRTKKETLEMGGSGNEGSERSGSKMEGKVTEVRV